MIKTLLAKHEGAPKELKTHAFIRVMGAGARSMPASATPTFTQRPT